MLWRMRKHVFLFFMMLSALTAFARIGETPAQCNARYGASITNVVGSGDILGFSEYCKDGINVVTVFNRKNKKACFVMYSRGTLRTSDSRHSSISFLKENEIASFLASLPDSWGDPRGALTAVPNGFSHVETLAPPRSTKKNDFLPQQRQPAKAIATETTVDKNLKAARAAIEKALTAITLEREYYDYKQDHVRWVSLSVGPVGALRLGGSVSLEAYKRNGSHVFAFKLIDNHPLSKGCVGLVIFDSEYSRALSSWAETHIKTTKEVKLPEDKGPVLQGF